MLTPYDIKFMEDCVMDAIDGWNTKVTIRRPLPESQQPNWNPIMREYTGDVQYITLVNVPAERKDMTNVYHDNIKVETNVGRKDFGEQLYAVPSMFNGEQLIIDTNCIFNLPNDPVDYYVRTVRYRIGEYIVILSRYSGGTPSGDPND